MHRMKRVALVLSVFAGACAQVPMQDRDVAPAATPQWRSQYEQGLAHYRDKRFDAALNDLSAAISSGRLERPEELEARKRAAFIHCSAGRELPCREHFRAILDVEPDFDIAADEAPEARWSLVWRSIKGAVEERRAVTQAGSAGATPAQHKLAEGIREYDAVRYRHSLDALQAAVKAGLPSKADEMRAHKYIAFASCLTRRMKQCRAEFRLMFEKDPAFELLPSESGHPAWAAVYRSEKAAAAKKGISAKAEK